MNRPNGPSGTRARSTGSATRRVRAADRAGFTLIELLVVMAVVGILAGLAMPNLQTVLTRARATELAGDMDVVRVATLSYHAERLTWPSESAAGNVPADLAPYLPDGFTFARDGYQLDFENWSIPGGLPGDPGTQQLIGVSVVVADETLGNALMELLGDAIVVSVGGTHTVLIDRS